MEEAPLSEYELQREANVARNQAVLAALGLGGDNSLKPPKPPKKPTPKPNPDAETDAEPKVVRRSGRSTNAPPSYAEGLSDAFMCAEEKQLSRRERERQSDRPQRKRQAPSYHSDEQGDAILARDEANAAKRRARQAELERQARQQQTALIMRAPSATPVLPSMASMPVMPVVSPPAAVKKQWRVDQPVVKCVRCGGLWAQRKDGRVRDHYCSPLVSTTAPVVAHLPTM